MNGVRSKRDLSKILRWVGSLGSLILFVILLTRQNWNRVWLNLQHVPPLILLLVFALYICGQILNAVRWYILLHSQTVKISFADTLRVIFCGAFISNFLPSTIGGDAFRIIAISGFIDNRPVSIGSVLLDRFANVLAMMTMLPFSWAAFHQTLTTFFLPETALTQAAGLAIWSRKAGGWFGSTLRKIFIGLINALKLWARQPAVLAEVYVTSWFSIFVVMVGVWILASYLGIPVKLYHVMGIMAITYLLTLLPISFNGYGVREVAITTLYMQLGATLEQASMLALITRVFMMVETLPGALWVTRFLPGMHKEI